MSKYLTYYDENKNKKVITTDMIYNLEKPKILWTNPNPNSAFAGETSIELSSSDYDYLIWITKGIKNGVDFGISGTFITTKDYTQWYMSSAAGRSGNQLINIFRIVKKESDTKWRISMGYYYNQNGGTTSYERQDYNLIPQYVIGYKTGLF